MRKRASSFTRRLIAAAGCLVAAAAFAAEGDPWIEALAQRDVTALERLVARGADVNRANAAGYTALMIAAAQGDRALVRELIEHGADVNRANSRGGTALMFAAAIGDVESIELLLSRGAAVGARAANGWTALTLASARGFAAAAARLLAQGADPNVADIYGWTPLMRALDLNRPAVVRVLLASPRTELEARNEGGYTALHHAAAQGLTPLVRLLIERGADADARDPHGRTPSALAKMQGHRDIAELIDRARRR